MIFVIDDELVIRSLMQRLLEAEGYQVIVAENGATAREMWKKHQASVVLLLIDWIMPGGSTGRELAREFLQAKPSLPVIFISGYDLRQMEAKPENDTSFMQKPFDIPSLLKMIKTALKKNNAYVANPDC